MNAEFPRSKMQNFDTNAFATDEARWAAVVGRDPNADGSFYYSVKTTGVYCRPSCAARLARRENVAFHASPEAAERAGFRPCKRCNPTGEAPAVRRARVVAEACQMIEQAEEPPTLDALAQMAGLSRHHFHRLFTSIVGVTPKAYADAERTRRVGKALDSGASVTEAIYEAGFNSSGRFYESSSERLGMTPTKFRAGGVDTTIRFAVGECSLGAVLVAATRDGVCAIFLGDDPGELVHDLDSRFPNAELIGGDEDFEQLVARVVGLVDHPAQNLDLPLDIRGTAFQRRVWEALRQIPAGETATYSEIAARIGMPKAVRAVANACANNKIAIAIPCHRVVRRGGDLSGYRWGVERKRALLARERAR